ncbi:GNAT family N-acetyltransferase [Marinobacterium rhizophilum]|uniref:GNAT family N-acetyltransferase n=1 Tax=Marinobacterium rhizophilum TaxID=420402 RepID=UPI000375CEA9|nr:GNAT family N-acetyltransferase [Marinobacterium rhizophilum]
MPTSDCRLRPQEPSDQFFLQYLYASTRAAEMSASGWDVKTINAFVQQQFELQSHHYQQHFPDAELWLIERDGHPIGRLYLYWGETSVQLIDISLLPEVRGTGLGSALLAEVIARAGARGCAVELHVESHNPALRLYQRLGFDIVEDKGIYLEMRRPGHRVQAPEHAQPIHRQ